MNLNDYRRAAGFKTIKAFAEAARKAGVRADSTSGFTANIASQWLNGMRSGVNETPLLTLLSIDRETYYEAREASHEEAEARWRAKHPRTHEDRRGMAG